MEGQVGVRARPRDDLRCPLCLDAMEAGQWPDEARARCPACATPHHAACLRELGGCAVLGCKGALPDLATPDRERAAIRARAQQRARRFVKGEGLGDARADAADERRELRPDLGAEDDDRHFWCAERWLWTGVFALGAAAAFGGVYAAGTSHGWPASAVLGNAVAAAVVVAIGGVFVVHARAPRR